MRIAGASPPDVAARIRRLGFDLRIELARALARHQHLDARRLLERGDHRPAPFFLHRAIDDELALRDRAKRRGQRKRGHERPDQREQSHGSSCFQRVIGMPMTAASLPQSAALVAINGLPDRNPSPPKKSLVKPPASRTSTIPAAQSHELMWSSVYASTRPAATSTSPSAPEPARRIAPPAS